MKGHWRRILTGLAATTIATLAVAGTANAGVLVTSAQNCAPQTLEQPFKRWLDGASYALLPGGSFEAGAPGWSLGGAKVVTGNEPWKVHRSTDAKSLSLPAGSSAVSAPICVGLEHPTLRFFARKNSGLVSTLAVSAIVRLELGGTLEVPVGVVAGGSWAPTLPYLYLGNLLPLLPGQYTPVSFRFTPLLGSWQIDDVYVDPWRMR